MTDAAATIWICATRELKIGKTDYTFADKVDYDDHVKRGDLDDRVGRYIKDVNQIVPLTRLLFERTIIQRPEGTIPRGFTAAELVERGLVDAPEDGAPAKAPPRVKKSVKEVAQTLKGLDPIPYNGRVIQPVKQGNFVRYEAKTEAGELLRESRFMKVDGAKAFIDGLDAEKQSGNPGPADQSGQENQDGSDVQPGASHAA
jgi:hypothetical protein